MAQQRGATMAGIFGTHNFGHSPAFNITPPVTPARSPSPRLGTRSRYGSGELGPRNNFGRAADNFPFQESMASGCQIVSKCRH